MASKDYEVIIPVRVRNDVASGTRDVNSSVNKMLREQMNAIEKANNEQAKSESQATKLRLRAIEEANRAELADDRRVHTEAMRILKEKDAEIQKSIKSEEASRTKAIRQRLSDIEKANAAEISAEKKLLNEKLRLRKEEDAKYRAMTSARQQSPQIRTSNSDSQLLNEIKQAEENDRKRIEASLGNSASRRAAQLQGGVKDAQVAAREVATVEKQVFKELQVVEGAAAAGIGATFEKILRGNSMLARQLGSQVAGPTGSTAALVARLGVSLKDVESKGASAGKKLGAAMLEGEHATYRVTGEVQKLQRAYEAFFNLTSRARSGEQGALSILSKLGVSAKGAQDPQGAFASFLDSIQRIEGPAARQKAVVDALGKGYGTLTPAITGASVAMVEEGEAATKTATGLFGMSAGMTAILGVAAAVVIAIVAVVAVFGFLFTKTLEGAAAFGKYGDEIYKLQAKVGGTAGELSKLIFLSKETGVGADALGRAYSRLQVNIDKGITQPTSEAGRAIKTLKIDFDLLSKATPDQQLIMVVTALNNLDNQNVKAHASSALLGKGFQQLAPALKALGTNYEDISRAVEKYHLNFTQEQIDRAHRYEIAQRNLSLAWQGFLMQVGERAVPALINVFDRLSDVLANNSSSWVTLGNDVAGAINWIRKAGAAMTAYMNASTGFAPVAAYAAYQEEGKLIDFEHLRDEINANTAKALRSNKSLSPSFVSKFLSTLPGYGTAGNPMGTGGTDIFSPKTSTKETINDKLKRQLEELKTQYDQVSEAQGHASDAAQKFEMWLVRQKDAGQANATVLAEVREQAQKVADAEHHKTITDELSSLNTQIAELENKSKGAFDPLLEAAQWFTEHGGKDLYRAEDVKAVSEAFTAIAKDKALNEVTDEISQLNVQLAGLKGHEEGIIDPISKANEWLRAHGGDAKFAADKVKELRQAFKDLADFQTVELQKQKDNSIQSFITKFDSRNQPRGTTNLERAIQSFKSIQGANVPGSQVESLTNLIKAVLSNPSGLVAATSGVSDLMKGGGVQTNLQALRSTITALLKLADDPDAARKVGGIISGFLGAGKLDTPEGRVAARIKDEDERLKDELIQSQQEIAVASETSSIRYQIARQKAYNEVVLADDAARESMIRSQVQIADATVMHSDQVRAAVYDHLASQITVTQAFGNTIIGVYDKITGTIDKGIDKLGHGLSFINDILKAIVHQLLNRVFQAFLGGGAGNQGSAVSGGGGFLNSIMQVFTGGRGSGPGGTPTFAGGSLASAFGLGGGVSAPRSLTAGGLPINPTHWDQIMKAAGIQQSGGGLGLGSLGMSVAGFSPLIGLGLGASLGGSSLGGQALGAAGGLLAGGGLAAFLGAGIFDTGGIAAAGGSLSWLAPLLTNPFTIAAAGALIVGAIILKKKQQRDKDEKTRATAQADADTALLTILSSVKTDQMTGSEADAQIAKIYQQWVDVGNSMKDSKTRNIHMAAWRDFQPIIDAIHAEAAKQTQRANIRARMVPVFGSGGFSNADQLIKVRPGEGMRYPGTDFVNTIPGRDLGYDSKYMYVPKGTQIIPQSDMKNTKGYQNGSPGVGLPNSPSVPATLVIESIEVSIDSEGMAKVVISSPQFGAAVVKSVKVGKGKNKL